MGPIDRNIIEGRILRIRRNLRELEKYRKYSEEEYLKDFGAEAAVERLLEVSIQSAIDIGSYLIVEKRLEPPTEYRQVFEILGKNGMLSKDLADHLAQAAGLRNRLAHGYMEIDSQKIYQFLHSNLSDLEAYCQEVLKLLSEKS